MLTIYTLLFTVTYVALAKGQTVIPTTPFTPVPIRITPADLPAPFSTISATKPAIVVAVPSNANLSVADAAFRVTVFRSGLRSPRQMIYTPAGEILIVESSGNIISILSNDQITTFADASNGVARSFGVAFIPVRLI